MLFHSSKLHQVQSLYIESLFTIFFWVGGVKTIGKFLGLVGNMFVLGKEFGGLEVRKMWEFNTALLGKWCWRMLVDRRGLWYKVLVTHYGKEAERLVVRGWISSSWWREVDKIRDG